MYLPQNYNFTFTGYDNYYEQVEPLLECLLTDALQGGYECYLMAISEAVCNAARYSVAGEDRVSVCLDILINEGDIKTIIQADTQPFDVCQFRQDMNKLAADELLSEMDWGEYTAFSGKSRGFWYMLMACEYIFVDVTGDRITLCARRPFEQHHMTKKIGELVQRFYVEKDGVIF